MKKTKNWPDDIGMVQIFKDRGVIQNGGRDSVDDLVLRNGENLDSDSLIWKSLNAWDDIAETRQGVNSDPFKISVEPK